MVRRVRVIRGTSPREDGAGARGMIRETGTGGSLMVPSAIAFSESALIFYKVMSIMGVIQHKLLHNYLVIADLLAMAFSFLVATSVVVSEVDGVPLTEFFSIRISILNFIIFMGFAFALVYHIGPFRGILYQKTE